MNKKVKMMVEYGFTVAEEVALYTLECSTDLLHPSWQEGKYKSWAQDRLEDLVMRANALLLEGSL